MSNDASWLSEYERIGEDFAAGKMDEGEFVNRMTHLGFDSDEIADHIIAVEDSYAGFRRAKLES